MRLCVRAAAQPRGRLGPGHNMVKGTLVALCYLGLMAGIQKEFHHYCGHICRIFGEVRQSRNEMKVYAAKISNAYVIRIQFALERTRWYICGVIMIVSKGRS